MLPSLDFLSGEMFSFKDFIEEGFFNESFEIGRERDLFSKN